MHQLLVDGHNMGWKEIIRTDKILHRFFPSCNFTNWIQLLWYANQHFQFWRKLIFRRVGFVNLYFHLNFFILSKIKCGKGKTIIYSKPCWMNFGNITSIKFVTENLCLRIIVHCLSIWALSIKYKVYLTRLYTRQK